MMLRQGLAALGHQPLICLDLSFDLTLFIRHLLRLLQGVRRLWECLGSQRNEGWRTLLHVLKLASLLLGRCNSRALGRSAWTDATVVDIIGGQVKDNVRSLICRGAVVERVAGSRARSIWAWRSDGYGWHGRDGCRCRWLS